MGSVCLPVPDPLATRAILCVGHVTVLRGWRRGKCHHRPTGTTTSTTPTRRCHSANTIRETVALDADTAVPRAWGGKGMQAQNGEDEEQEEEEKGEEEEKDTVAQIRTAWTVYMSYMLCLLQSYGKTNNIWRVSRSFNTTRSATTIPSRHVRTRPAHRIERSKGGDLHYTEPPLPPMHARHAS